MNSNAPSATAEDSSRIPRTQIPLVQNAALTHLQVQPCKRLTQLNEKWSENGVFQKFRISNKISDTNKKASRNPRSKSGSNSPPSTVPRQPSPSQHQELSRRLVEALSTGGAGHRMSAFGPFIQEVPARIGHNAALDAAVACLVYAHSSMVHKRNTHEIANPGLYLRAVQTLQTCLEDPLEGMSSNTLCASVLLGLVEVRFLFTCLTSINHTKLLCVGSSGAKGRQSVPGSCWRRRTSHGAPGAKKMQ